MKTITTTATIDLDDVLADVDTDDLLEELRGRSDVKNPAALSTYIDQLAADTRRIGWLAACEELRLTLLRDDVLPINTRAA